MKRALACAALCLGLIVKAAAADGDFPARPLRMIVPFAPGGASDYVARIVAPALSDLLGQQVIIENRAGAAGNIGLEAAARAGLEVPFSCRSGVCCTCRAKLLEGQVRMARNFSLERKELDQGFILTCQSHPLSAAITISFDER